MVPPSHRGAPRWDGGTIGDLPCCGSASRTGFRARRREGRDVESSGATRILGRTRSTTGVVSSAAAVRVSPGVSRRDRSTSSGSEGGAASRTGRGPVSAATILGEVADIRRYRSRHAFAAANGTGGERPRGHPLAGATPLRRRSRDPLHDDLAAGRAPATASAGRLVRQRQGGRVLTAGASCGTGPQSLACCSLRSVHRTHRRPERCARPALTHGSSSRV